MSDFSDNYLDDDDAFEEIKKIEIVAPITAVPPSPKKLLSATKQPDEDGIEEEDNAEFNFEEDIGDEIDDDYD